MFCNDHQSAFQCTLTYHIESYRTKSDSFVRLNNDSVYRCIQTRRDRCSF